MDRSTVKQMRSSLEGLFGEFEKKYNVKVQLGNASYSDSNATFKLEVSDVNADGSVLSKDAEAFQKQAKFFGLEPEDLGSTFKQNGQEFTICGLKPRSHKYPVLAKNGKGQTYKFGADIVKMYLKLSASV